MGMGVALWILLSYSPFALDGSLFQPSVDPNLGPSTSFPQLWRRGTWVVWSGAQRRFSMEDLEEIQVFVVSPWGGLSVHRYGPPAFRRYTLAIGKNWEEMGWAVIARMLEVEEETYWTPGVRWGAGAAFGEQTLDVSADLFLDTLTPWVLRVQYRLRLEDLTPALAATLEEGQPLTLSAALVHWVHPDFAMGFGWLSHPPSYALAVYLTPSSRFRLVVEDRFHPALGHTPSLWIQLRGEPLPPETRHP